MTYIAHMKTTDQYGQQVMYQNSLLVVGERKRSVLTRTVLCPVFVQWERKRFIGNDIVVIVFYEGKTPLDPNIFVSNFNHVFALVVPEMRNGKTYYRYADLMRLVRF